MVNSTVWKRMKHNVIVIYSIKNTHYVARYTYIFLTIIYKNATVCLYYTTTQVSLKGFIEEIQFCTSQEEWYRTTAAIK